ncbi:MAG: GNAT family protein [Candidatus Thorarchaeota archaeon]|nr:GNAT family protein [Candidatus Thorarchaeota archaeon]
MDPLLLEIPEEFESERLIIRKYRKGDGIDFFEIFERNNNREQLKENVDEVESVKTEEDAEVRIRQVIVDWEARKRFVMTIWLKESESQIGQIWIEDNRWDVPSFELGWFLDSGYWGRGYATEAAKRAMEFIFGDLGAHKIVVTTRDYNEKSYKLAERLGFIKEGHFREGRIDKGRRYGLLHYGMLKEEYA